MADQLNGALGFNPALPGAKVSTAQGGPLGSIGNIINSIFNNTGSVQLGSKAAATSPVTGGGGGGGWGNDGAANVLGETFAPIPTPYFSQAVGGTGGGGGYAAAAAEAAKQKALIDQRKAALIGNADSLYNDTVMDLNKASELLTNQQGASKGFIEGDKAANITDLERRGESGQRQARQQYQDLQLEARRRARAVGGGTGSAFQDLTGRLDQELIRNIGDINQGVTDSVGKVNNIALKALSDLQLNYDQSVAQIESDKRKSAREKTQAIQDAEMDAADAALKVDEWARSRISSSKGASITQQNAANKSSIQAQYAQALAEATSGKYGADIDQAVALLNRSFAPAIAQTGANYQNSQDLLGYMNPTQYTKSLFDAQIANKGQYADSLGVDRSLYPQTDFNAFKGGF